MATLHSDKEIAQAFRTLGHTDRRIGTGRIAAWAGWATIALFTVAFFSSVVFLLSSEQRAESVRLKQSADLVAQAMESRLLGTTELLMKTSLRLMHIPNVRSQVASAELSATNFMQDRREVAEIVIATRDFTVLRSWNNPMSSGSERRDQGTTLKNPNTRKAITEALERDSSVLSIPYVLDPTNQLFADLAVPTALPRPNPHRARQPHAPRRAHRRSAQLSVVSVRPPPERQSLLPRPEGLGSHERHSGRSAALLQSPLGPEPCGDEPPRRIS